MVVPDNPRHISHGVCAIKVFSLIFTPPLFFSLLSSTPPPTPCTHSVPLAAETIKELDGKLVNFVGYEFDLVRKRMKMVVRKTEISSSFVF